MNLHPHIHAIAASGVWAADDRFESIPALDPKHLMLLFRHHVIKNLLAAGRLRIISFIDNPGVIERLLKHLKLWDPPQRPPPPKHSTILEPDADFLAWQATSRLFDRID